MKVRIILFVLFAGICIAGYSQSGLSVVAGVSMSYTDNPNTSSKGEMINGFHAGLNGRIGRNYWFFKPGVELHVMKFYPEKLLNPFSDKPAMYLIKVPAQIGVRLFKTDFMALRVAGGLQFSFTAGFDNNSDNFNHNTIKDTQLGTLIGAGIDLGPMCIDVNFEKGLTELYTGTGYKADYIFISAGFFF
jgi:hypothetical protein